MKEELLASIRNRDKEGFENILRKNGVEQFNPNVLDDPMKVERMTDLLEKAISSEEELFHLGCEFGSIIG